jgi:hypothetical protein
MFKRGLLRWSVFVIAPLVGLEIFWRVYLLANPGDSFYERASLSIAPASEHDLFIGSSRVAAAIDVPAFLDETKAGTGPPQVINLGAGGSTMAMHYLGLRHLIDAHPSALRRCNVFIEAPGGLADAGSWDSPWVFEEYPLSIVAILNRADLRRFLRQSDNSIKAKGFVTAAYFSAACYKIPGFRGHIMLAGEKRFDAWSHAWVRPHGSESRGDLTEAGGIRNDAAGVQLARERAIADAERGMSNQQPIGNWDRSIMADIVKLIHGVNGKVVFFQPPLSSVQRKPFETELRQRDRRMFADQLKAWNCVLLSPNAAFADEDFPDFWHLRKTSAPIFTRALAKAYRVWRDDAATNKPSP